MKLISYLLLVAGALLNSGCVSSNYKLDAATDKTVYLLEEDSVRTAAWGIVKVTLFKGEYRQVFIGDRGVYLQSSTPMLFQGVPTRDAYLFIEKGRNGRQALWFPDWGNWEWSVKWLDKPIDFRVIPPVMAK